MNEISYKKESRIARIYQKVIDFENYAFEWLEDDPKLFNKIKRNTNSIKAMLNKASNS